MATREEIAKILDIQLIDGNWEDEEGMFWNKQVDQLLALIEREKDKAYIKGTFDGIAEYKKIKEKGIEE